MAARSVEEVAALFRARRKQLGLTQAQAAENAGVAVPTWIRFEAGGRCTPATRRSIALALGWAIDAHARLLVGDDPETLETIEPEPISRDDGLEQVAAILHRMGLTADRIDISLTLIQRLVEQP